MVLGLSIGAAALLIAYGDVVSRLGDWGYLGVFVIQLLNSAMIVIPAPGHAYTFTAAATLSPILVGLIGGFGATVGELTGYAFGASGHQIVSGGPLYQRLSRFTQRWGGVALFLFAALPLPFDIAGVWAGATRYPIWRFLLYVLLGKIIFITSIAFAGFYSMPRILRFFA